MEFFAKQIVNAFLEGLQALTGEIEIDLCQFVLDLFGFLKCSAKRIKDYFNVESFTEMQGCTMMKYVTTRWISLQDVLIRIMEQFPNLKEYFLKVLPSQKGFKGKSGVESQDRYIRIKKLLNSKKLPAIAFGVIYVLQAFKAFTVALQARPIMITVLYDKMAKLIKGTLLKFLVKEDFLVAVSGVMKSMKKLRILNLEESKIQKVWLLLM